MYYHNEKASVFEHRATTCSCSDVILLVGTEFRELHAVGFLLARVSPVFEEKLRLHTITRIRVLSVPGEYSSSSIKGIIRVSEGLTPKVKPKNLFNMRAAAKHYAIQSLIEDLENKIMRMMRSEEHFIWVLHSALVALDVELVNKCFATIVTLDQQRVFRSKHFSLLGLHSEYFSKNTAEKLFELYKIQHLLNCKTSLIVQKEYFASDGKGHQAFRPASISARQFPSPKGFCWSVSVATKFSIDGNECSDNDKWTSCRILCDYLSSIFPNKTQSKACEDAPDR